MKLPSFIKENVLLKITSLNAGVILIRLFIGFFIQRELTQHLVSGGYAKVGSLRNLLQILSSFSSFGIFNGIVKYVAQHKENKEELQKLFSTAFVFIAVGSIISFVLLFIFSESISTYFFFTPEYSYLVKIIALIAPFIAVQRVFNGVINGLSEYKYFAKIELLAYIISSLLTVWFLYQFNLNGVFIAIIFTPIVQVLVVLFVFLKELENYIQFTKIRFKSPIARRLLAFSIMSFVSTILLNFIETDIRGMIEKKISGTGADVWTAITVLSKNYMVFTSAVFTLYVIPKFAGIYEKKYFLAEVKNIYKTLLPLFAIGMTAIYIFRQLFIDYIFVDYKSMEPLFKWQLIGDFVKLISLVLAYQFIAKKMVRSYVFTEIFSLLLFYIIANYLVTYFNVEGVVIAHFIRSIVMLFIITFLVLRHYSNNHSLKNNV